VTEVGVASAAWLLGRTPVDVRVRVGEAWSVASRALLELYQLVNASELPVGVLVTVPEAELKRLVDGIVNPVSVASI
jgi:hypothetical protein